MTALKTVIIRRADSLAKSLEFVTQLSEPTIGNTGSVSPVVALVKFEQKQRIADRHKIDERDRDFIVVQKKVNIAQS